MKAKKELVEKRKNMDMFTEQMEGLLILFSIVLIAGGIIFSILPPFPGPLLSYLALVITHHISDETGVSTTSFIIWGILGALIIVGDFILPIAATRRFGGTKSGIIGGMIGTIGGLILPIPFGIIIGPLLGAIIGDLYGGNHIRSAFKSGFGSLLGFLLATSIKLTFSIILGVVVLLKIGSFSYQIISEWF